MTASQGWNQEQDKGHTTPRKNNHPNTKVDAMPAKFPRVLKMFTLLISPPSPLDTDQKYWGNPKLSVFAEDICMSDQRFENSILIKKFASHIRFFFFFLFTILKQKINIFEAAYCSDPKQCDKRNLNCHNMVQKNTCDFTHDI